MHFDALTLASVADELTKRVKDGRVQQIVLVDAHTLGMEIYAQHQRFQLLVSGRPTQGRVHLASAKLRRGVERDTPLLLLLRKYVRAARLADVVQPNPYERALRLQFEHAEHGATTLIVEPIGRAANLILAAADGRIMEALHHVRSGQSVRPIQPGLAYRTPPAQQKLPPLDDHSVDYLDRLAALLQTETPLWKTLVSQVDGVSPSLAREVAWRAGGNSTIAAQEVDLPALVQALQQLWQPIHSGEWQPGIWREQGEVRGFSVYVCQSCSGFEATPTISEAVERFYLEQQSRVVDAYAALRTTIGTDLTRAIKRVQRQISALEADEPAPGEPERLRTEAEWLLALNTQIESTQREVSVDLGGETLTIRRELTLSPVEQAQRMFKRAAKLERAAVIIPKRRTALSRDLEYLEQLQADLMLAENQPEIMAIRQEVQRLGLLSAQRTPKKGARHPRPDATPRRYRSGGGFEILVGRNARQNEVVTFKMAHADDLWLHARGVPGSHVVVRLRGEEVDEETLLAAAALAAYYSKARGEHSAPVIIVPRNQVSRAAGGRTGQVRVRGEQSVSVAATMPPSVQEI